MAFPPGPKAPQIVQMFEWLLFPVRFLERNSKRYGDLFRMRIAGFNAIMVADPALIKEIFTGDPDVLHAGKANAAPLEPIVGKNSVLLLDGPEHMRQRKLMLPSFQGARMREYGPLIAEITTQQVDSFPAGRSFALRAHMQAITLEVIMRAVFGIRRQQRLEQLRPLLTDLLSTGSSPLALAGIALPVLRDTIGRRTWARFVRTRNQVGRLLMAEIAERRTMTDVDQRSDVLSILLQAVDDRGRSLTDHELRDELMTLLAAGHETTATALAWTFDLLLHNSDKLSALQRELREQPAGGEYLDAVIKEALRLRPVIPAVARVLQAPLTLAGYTLPAGTRIAPNVYLTHRRPDVYPRPNDFEPERFLADDPPDTYGWIPFGGGIRRCLGAAFAVYEMKVVVCEILARVELTAANPRPETVRRRAITFAPRHDTHVVAARRSEHFSASTQSSRPVPA